MAKEDGIPAMELLLVAFGSGRLSSDSMGAVLPGVTVDETIPGTVEDADDVGDAFVGTEDPGPGEPQLEVISASPGRASRLRLERALDQAIFLCL